MITLNLLPPELKRKKRTLTHLKVSSIPQIPIFKICLVVAGGLVLIHSLLLLVLVFQSYSLRALKAKWETIAEKRQIVSELTQRHDDLAAREKMIQQLLSHRSLWSRKLKGLSDSMVPGAWLRVLSLDKRLLPAPAAPAKGAPNFERKILVLEGTVVSLRGDELAIIGRFVRRLKEDQNFFSDFQGIEVESTKRRTIHDIEVVDFKLLCLFREGASP